MQSAAALGDRREGTRAVCEGRGPCAQPLVTRAALMRSRWYQQQTLVPVPHTPPLLAEECNLYTKTSASQGRTARGCGAGASLNRAQAIFSRCAAPEATRGRYAASRGVQQ